MVAAEPASAASAFSASYQRSQAMITTKPSSTAYSTPITANLKPATSLLVRSRASGIRWRTRIGPIMASTVNSSISRSRTHTGRLVRKCMGGERRRAAEPVQSAPHPAVDPCCAAGYSCALYFSSGPARCAPGAISVSIKSDNWIRRMAREQRMIEPFEPGQVRLGSDGHKIVSYGTSSYGYDVRCASEFKIFTNINSTIVDPKAFDEKSFVDFSGDVCIIPPNSFALARTVEYFRVPRNVLIITVGKSTFARCGIIVNVTPLEPEWEGHVTLEFSNTTPLPAKIYANEGVAQMLFFESDEVCATSYKDRGGKYQGQRGVTLPKT